MCSEIVGSAMANSPQIDEIRSRGKLPILVGGTHYYTQSLLFKDTLPDEALPSTNEDGRRQFPILDEPTGVILEKLKEVDPVMADRWHPNERRKIQRSLEIYLKTGKPASQIYDEQRLKRELSPSAPNSDPKGERTNDAGLRSPTLVLWVHASKEVLYPRLDSRVDKMLDRGLLAEVETLTNFRTSCEAQTGQTVDQSRGIWVSIGYKEFLDYQTALTGRSASRLDLANTKTAAIEKTQAGTRQYAKRQVRWIQIKLLNALINVGHGNNIFLLDGTDLSKWESQVIQPANDITNRFLLGQPLPDAAELSRTAREMLTPKRDYDLAQRPDLWQKRVCEACGTVAVTENDWNLHIKSRAHRRAVGAKKKQDNVKASSRPVKAPREDLVDVLESYMENFPDDERMS